MDIPIFWLSLQQIMLLIIWLYNDHYREVTQNKKMVVLATPRQRDRLEGPPHVRHTFLYFLSDVIAPEKSMYLFGVRKYGERSEQKMEIMEKRIDFFLGCENMVRGAKQK